MTKAEYGYVGDVTLKEFAEIKKAFPDLMGIGVTEVKGEQFIALGVPSDLGDKACGMYQSIVAVFFDDDLRKKVTDVVWGGSDDKVTEAEYEAEYDALMYEMEAWAEKAEQYKADAIKWAKKCDDFEYQYNKLYTAYRNGKLVFKED